MKKTARLLLLSLVFLLAASMFSGALAGEDGYTSSYTYNYDYWQDEIEMPDAYRVDQVIYSDTLKLEVPMNKPQSLYIRDNFIYVADTGNNRVIEIEVTEKIFDDPNEAANLVKENYGWAGKEFIWGRGKIIRPDMEAYNCVSDDKR